MPRSYIALFIGLNGVQHNPLWMAARKRLQAAMAEEVRKYAEKYLAKACQHTMREIAVLVHNNPSMRLPSTAYTVARGLAANKTGVCAVMVWSLYDNGVTVLPLDVHECEEGKWHLDTSLVRDTEFVQAVRHAIVDFDYYAAKRTHNKKTALDCGRRRCTRDAAFLCPHCSLVGYCSPRCAQKHSTAHAAMCKTVTSAVHVPQQSADTQGAAMDTGE